MLASAFGPITWMSIGAGAPKLRIWLMMSAGRKEKVGSRKSGCQIGAQTRHIFVGWAMPFAQGNQHVAVLRTDGAGIVVCLAFDAADRQSYIVDDAAQFICRYRRRGPPCSIWSNSLVVSSMRVPTCRAHMHLDLTGVDGRKEIPAQPWRQPRTKPAQSQEMPKVKTRRFSIASDSSRIIAVIAQVG